MNKKIMLLARNIPSQLNALVCLSLFFNFYILGESLIAQAHFDEQGNISSSATAEIQSKLRDSLAFSDLRDQAEAERGFLAHPEFKQIRDSTGRVVWDLEKYDFLLNGESFDSIHPSLQRQAILNMNYGLYEVVPDFIYQVRGFDLANMTVVRGNTGWIVFDVLLSSETARAALELINKELGTSPVSAIIYSHSHIDHFGGVLGIVSVEEVSSGEVEIYAPSGFMREVASENVYAGTAMGRRAGFQYGGNIPSSPFGQVDSAIGKGLSRGSRGLIPPTVVVSEAFEEHTIDGVNIVFQNTPGTEAPAEMNAWFPDRKVFWAAENITATIHNIYTLRGALVRDALEWSKQINRALYEYGQEAEVMISSHNWPRWGNERIQEVMRSQRDAYANLNNQVLFHANNGVTINEIHNEYKVPKSLEKKWSARQYHGSEFHNARAVINRYLGYWDGNPATLVPLSPYDSAPLYVDMMGGASSIILRAEQLYSQGEYRLAMEILNKLVYAKPNNTRAKNLLADVFEQLGYQYESASLRNVFLSSASELRNGILVRSSSSTGSNSLQRALTTAQWWDAIGTRIDSEKADEMNFIINFSSPDTGENFVIEMSGATLSVLEGYLAAKPDVSIEINRSDLEAVISGQETLASRLQAGYGSVSGDALVLAQLTAVIVDFEQNFEVLPGTEKLID
jgi:alkyl sulfatase BDS1-like metallo-beta-lactamase superfamily hydrolase